MTGDEKRRFCTDCDKTVYNFAEMTRGDVESLLRETGGKICARILRDAEGFVVTAKTPFGLKLIPSRASKFASALVTAALSLSSSVAAKPLKQNSSNIIHLTYQKNKETIPDKTPINLHQQDATATVKGTIFDINKAVIVGAKVRLKDENTIIDVTTYSDALGTYIFEGVPQGSYTIEFFSPGFKKSLIIGIPLKLGKEVKLNITLEVTEAIEMGIVAALVIDSIDPTIIPSSLLKLIEPIREKSRKPLKK
jgi:hypothetical protein